MPVACARHILVKTLEEAEKLKKRIDNGEDFGQLAKKHSTCPSKKRGGDLGEFRPGQMVKAFDNVVFKKPVLVVHGPVKTQFGFHLIQTIYRK
ncbi:peptidylprolyl isomerase [Parendozoicomonas haliclonae]|uniref:Peptidyl-prolyl cis-trans isomerase C n=1 Tax=Parendozoicomonas haliclonae TaxID=1960125 RepID=A0A1X7ANZ1_9GAMM|nr:peptidylprolyl isomerase [Parendozoicomonas haliclonae]SMA49818.1 Peptidyl-prolyl cis-trans isomerase C [Parendozoicomonas haliclonae]